MRTAPGVYYFLEHLLFLRFLDNDVTTDFSGLVYHKLILVFILVFLSVDLGLYVGLAISGLVNITCLLH